MLRKMLIVTAGALLAGCQTSGTGSPVGSRDVDSSSATTAGYRVQEVAQTAAWAATTQYPSAKATDDGRVTVTVNKRGNSMTLLNPTDRAITDAKVWVDGLYVAKVPSLPPHGTAMLRTNDFYDRAGMTLSDMSKPTIRVQIQTADGFYNALGPVFE